MTFLSFIADRRRIWLAIGSMMSLCCHADIQLTGVPGEIKKRLTNHLAVIDYPCQLTDRQRTLLTRRVDKELKQGLRALGYFNAQWQHKFADNAKCWKLSVEISTGPPLMIRSTDLQILGEASGDKHFVRLIKEAGLAPSTPFVNERYQTLKEKIQSRGLSKGYFDASFSQQQVAIYPEQNAADVSLVWDSGQRYRYGEIRIDQDALRPQLFERFLSLKSGGDYDLASIQSDRLSLSETRYFKTIDIKPLVRQRSNGRVPVEITGTAGKPDHYQAGVGFSTDTNVRLRGDYVRSRLNDRGHQGEINLLLSEVLATLNLNYTIPWRDPRTDALIGDLSFVDENSEAFDSRRWEATLAANVRSKSGWRRAIAANLSHEQGEIAGEKDTTLHLIPSYSTSRIIADNVLRPQRGYSFSFTLLGSLEGVLADSSFLQTHIELKWISPLPANFRLIARSKLGFSLADSIDDIPVSRRFFTGGDNSIRGYEYQSLGPTRDDEVIGGKHLAVASIEFERPVYRKWSAAIFADGGNAWNGSRLDPVYGVGVGIRWQSPIGPLRLDVGVPLDSEENDLRLHLSLGPEL